MHIYVKSHQFVHFTVCLLHLNKITRTLLKKTCKYKVIKNGCGSGVVWSKSPLADWPHPSRQRSMDTGVAFPSRPQADAVNLVPEPPQ